MHVEYYERDDDVSLNIRKDRDEIRVRQHDEHVSLEVEGYCENVFARVKLCLTCREYARLICELERVRCHRRPCEWCDCDEDERHERREGEVLVVFDQDDCDDPEPKPKPRPKKPTGRR